MKSNKKYVIDTEFIKESMKLNLSLAEFLLLAYFENADTFTFDIHVISEKLNLDQETILTAFNNLLSKNIISLISEKNESGKMYDKVSLDNFYKGIKTSQAEEKKKNLKEDIFSIFEREFARPLSGMEFEIIKAWVEKLYTEEIIIEALKEAVYNGATNIRYVDTILYEWNKLGIKEVKDLEKIRKSKFDSKKLEETNVFDYNWLDDYDK